MTQTLVTTLGKTGLICRFKPLHNGSALMLEYVCRNSEHVKIGIGSCNKYNLRNPFTADESREMITLYLYPRYKNFEFVYVPDFAQLAEFKDGQKWREYVKTAFGTLDYFVTANPWVRELLREDYKILTPTEIIPEEEWLNVSGTMTRIELAKAGDYRRLIPDIVSTYLEKTGLIERFKREFGLETLTLLTTDYNLDDKIAEKQRTTEK